MQDTYTRIERGAASKTSTGSHPSEGMVCSDLKRVLLSKNVRRPQGYCEKLWDLYSFPQDKNWFQNLPSGPGMELQVDHCGPFKDKDQDKFWILTCVDRFSGKLFATTVDSTSIDDVLIYLHEVVFQTLIPVRIHADRAFTNSEDFKEFCEQFKIEIRGGPGAESHGHVEVMNREIQMKLLRL